MSKMKSPVLSIILYALAGLLGLYTVWAAAYNYDNISTLVEQGQAVISGNEYELARYLMSDVGQYVLFAVILLSLGRILQTYSSVPDEYLVAEDVDDDTDESDFEGWDQKNNQ
jgi:hypothetical protein